MKTNFTYRPRCTLVTAKLMAFFLGTVFIIPTVGYSWDSKRDNNKSVAELELMDNGELLSEVRVPHHRERSDHSIVNTKINPS